MPFRTPKRRLTMVFFASAFALVSLFELSASAEGTTQPSPMATNSQTRILLSPYAPKETKSLDEVPAQVRKKLRAHLLDRLGDKYLSRLTFAGGQIVDIEELYRVDPSARNFKWQIFSYSLWFRLTAPDKGISEYFAEIQLDKSGEVLNEITLPPVRRHSLKGTFIPLSQAYAIATKHGFTASELFPQLGYDRKFESIVYRLEEAIGGPSSSSIATIIEIDAHSGTVLRIYKQESAH